MILMGRNFISEFRFRISKVEDTKNGATRMDKRIIWLIDEDEQQLKTYCNELKMNMPQAVQIETIFPPYRRKADYVSTILENPDTACVIIDQRLKETGIATYTGIELAQYLRGINKKIPIYILTNFADEEDEFAGGKWSVEYIIPKEGLSDEEGARTAKARILRHIDDAVGEPKSSG